MTTHRTHPAGNVHHPAGAKIRENTGQSGAKSGDHTHHQCLVCPPCWCVPHQLRVRRDTTILTESTLVVAGADTHLDTIHVAAISMTGALIGDREFPTTRAGYSAAIRFLTSLGQVQRIGVEGTASYGAGLTRALTTAGIEVVEVTRAVKSNPPADSKANRIRSMPTALPAPRWPAMDWPSRKTTPPQGCVPCTLLAARRSSIAPR